MVIPNPYVLLAAVGLWLASTIGAYFYGTAHEARVWKTSIAEQKVEASKILAASEKKVALAIAENLELNNRIEADHAKAQVEIVKAHDDLQRTTDRLNGVLRLARRGAGGADRVPAGTDPAGHRAATPTAAQLSAALERLVAGGNELFRDADAAASIGLACHAFAVGK